MDWIDLLLIVARVVGVFALLLLLTIVNVWLERKVVADMQNRLGPMRAGPWGILQTLADGLKLFFKEHITPRKVDLGAYLLAPFLAVVPAFLIFMMVPLGPGVEVGGRSVPLQGADLNIGLLFILAMSSMAVYAVVLAGWSSGSKYPLLGGVRATAQAISYEAAMGLAMVAVVMFSATAPAVQSGTLSLAEIVARQSGTWDGAVGFLDPVLGLVPRWNIFPQVVAFRDLLHRSGGRNQPGALRFGGGRAGVGGRVPHRVLGHSFCHVLSGRIHQHLFDVRHRRHVVPGGMERPGVGRSAPGWISAILPVVWLMMKTYLLVFFFFWIRATLPRLRYDQLMVLGWKRLIPLSMVWLVISTIVIGFRQFGLPFLG